MTYCLTLDLVVHPTQHVFCHTFYLDWFRKNKDNGRFTKDKTMASLSRFLLQGFNFSLNEEEKISHFRYHDIKNLYFL